MNTFFSYQQLPPDPENTTSKVIYEEKSDNSVKGFQILALQRMEMQQPLGNTVSGTINHFEILWIKKGNVIVQINDKTYNFTESHFYVIAPGNTRKYISNGGIEGYYISFTNEFIRLSEGYL